MNAANYKASHEVEAIMDECYPHEYLLNGAHARSSVLLLAHYMPTMDAETLERAIKTSEKLHNQEMGA